MFGRTCGSAACFFVARGPWVLPAPGLPCALSISKRASRRNTRTQPCRENEDAWHRHCEERQRRSNPEIARGFWIASLAITRKESARLLQIVIPGRAAKRRGPGIHTPDRGYGFRARAPRVPE